MGGDKARPIPQISLKIALMVPIWTLSNPLQCGGWGAGGGDGISWLISVDYLCQQWFGKLIVFYLHQCQTFLVKTARSEYTMSSYYETLGIVPYIVTFVPGSLYLKGKDIQNRVLRVVLNDYQISYQDLLNVVYHPTLFMGPVWKLLPLKCLNAWITPIPQAKDQGRASCAGCP